MTEEDALLAANAAYYHAFDAADLAEMGRVWAEDDVSCVHPGWPALVGREAVLESYRNIFRNPHRERLEHRDAVALASPDAGRVLCVEMVRGAAVALAASNWFRRIDGAWRLIHHQATPIATRAVEAAPSVPSGRLN